MLTPEQIEGFRAAAGRLTDPVNEYLLKDIAHRVQEAGGFTSTAAYEAWRAEWMGVSRKKLEKELAWLLGVTRQEAKKLLQTAAQYGYDTTLKKFPGRVIPFDANPALQQIVSSSVALAGDALKNITQTTAIMMVSPYGQYLPLAEAYRACTDFAFQQVITGATDYNTAIRQACAGIAKHGVSVAYASGVHTSLEAAVRRNIMGGLGLMTEKVEQQNHDDIGCNGWEISAHANSAPDHEPIQGKQYSDAEYEKLNNSLVRRIGTLNCGHVASPIILGVNQPQYTPEQLEKFRKDNETGVTFDGKHYTGYEATQMQRRLERAIRAQKRRVLLAAPDDAEPQKIRLVRLQQEYNRFSKGVGLHTEYERLEVSGFGAKQMRGAVNAAKNGKAAKQGRFRDITGNWFPDSKPGSHPVQELHEYVHGGATYKVDGHNVVLDHDAHEKEIAELLEREVGGEIYLVPRVNNPQGVSTPDYLFHGREYDLKTLSEKAGSNTMFQRVKKAKRQSRNFIIDVSGTKLDSETIKQQISKIFWSENTRFVDEIVIINGDRIIQVAKRV